MELFEVCAVCKRVCTVKTKRLGTFYQWNSCVITVSFPEVGKVTLFWIIHQLGTYSFLQQCTSVQPRSSNFKE